MLPSKPPPPYISAFWFQAVGSATRKRILGAEGSTGEMLPLTRQYSATSAAPEPAAGTSVALVTVAPVVGNPMALAGIANPFRSPQATGAAAAMGAVQASRMSATRPRPDKRSAPEACRQSISSPLNSVGNVRA